MSCRRRHGLDLDLESNRQTPGRDITPMVTLDDACFHSASFAPPPPWRRRRQRLVSEDRSVAPEWPAFLEAEGHRSAGE